MFHPVVSLRRLQLMSISICMRFSTFFASGDFAETSLLSLTFHVDLK